MATDLVIVGIGVKPEVALARDAGLDLDDGVKVDELGRTSIAGIWAAGDCASFPYRDRRIRLESVPHAIDQAESVAANICGAQRPYLAAPWFWSDQFDVKLQIAGLNAGYDRVVARNDGRPGAASHWYFRGNALLAVDAINDPRSFVAARKLLSMGIEIDPDDVANGSVDPVQLSKSVLRVPA